jgi:MYXO-CTERM domain-containing protein
VARPVGGTLTRLRLDGRHGRALALGAIICVTPLPARAADVQADPSNYRALLPTLQPGDTLHLAPGTYTDTLPIDDLNGNEGAWITITGPEEGDPAIVVADPGPCCNTVEITNSSYLVLRKLTIDGNHVDGAFGISAKSGVVHHVVIEDNDLVNHGTSQQNVGISTKVPTWGWVIRRNRITGVGTGLYLGNSDGSQPFINGLIEYNVVKDPIGYCMEIKWQGSRPSVPGMPTDPQSTVIRHNVFIKNDGPSPDGDRPNVLVGGFPSSGAGSEDRYQIYGNFFFHNPRESLLQASGRVTIHDNVFVDTAWDAIRLVDHDLPLRQAFVYNNTVYQADGGISFGSAAPDGDAVFGNLIFAATPTSGAIADERDNVAAGVAEAAQYVSAPSTVLGEMDFYPLANGMCQGAALDVAKVVADVDHDRDFNGTAKGGLEYRGAYAGEGDNPGWPLGDGIKTGGAMGSGGDGGSAGSGPGSGGSTGPGAGGSGAAAGAGADAGGAADGCSCATPGRPPPRGGLALVALALARALRRRRAGAPAHQLQPQPPAVTAPPPREPSR